MLLRDHLILKNLVKSCLLIVNRYLEKTNSTIAQLFDRSMNLILPNGVEPNNILLLVSNPATSCTRASNLFRLSKKSFLKCPASIQIFKNEAPELGFLPEPVFTR